MIYVTGDTHGDRDKVKGIIDQLELTEDDTLIVAGDFGFIYYDNYAEELVLNSLSLLPCTIAFVDGNHENFPAIYSDRYPVEEWNGGRVHRIHNNIYHLMRGQVFEIEGKKILAMGGAYSVDRIYRKQNVSFWEQEIPNDEEMEEAKRNLALHDYKVDYIITHTVPSSVKFLMGFEVSQNGGQDSIFTNFLDEEIRLKVCYKKWFAGHFHMNKIVSPADNIIVLYEGVQFLD